MIVLGIESTAHTFGMAVLEHKGKETKVLSNVIDAFKTAKGGMIPYQVADHHVEVCNTVLENALTKAGITIRQVDVIAYSMSPGLGPALRIGCMVARTLHAKYDIPVVGVNHCIAHLEVGKLATKAKDPVLLYVSGANTQVIAYAGNRYRIFGETLDIGVGNLLDVFARDLGLGFPGGPQVEKLALISKNYIELPYSVKGMDIALGGILTNLKQKRESRRFKKEDLCYSLQETVFAMLMEVAERAMAHIGKKELLLGGGVACNKRLQEMSHTMCKERGAECFVPENQFLIDNAAMIAFNGLQIWNARKRGLAMDEIVVDAYERTDEVEVDWL